MNSSCDEVDTVIFKMILLIFVSHISLIFSTIGSDNPDQILPLYALTALFLARYLTASQKAGLFMPILTETTKDKLAWGCSTLPSFFSSNMIIARGMAGQFPPLSMAFIRWFFVGIFIIDALLFFVNINGKP